MRATPKAKVRPPVRVRYDPPTLEEAVFAAQGFADEPEHQAEIAAELMGVSIEEAREMVAKFVAKAGSVKRQASSEVAFTTNRSGAQRAVVVERKPSVTVERKSAAGTFSKVERSGGVTVERKPFRSLSGGAPRTLIRLGGR